MKVLYVDQFARTAGRDSLAQCQYIYEHENVDVTVYLSDNAEIPSNVNYTLPIEFGFHGAYEGNIIHKVINYLKALGELLDFVKKNNFDIVHLQWFSLPWIEGMFVEKLKKYAKVVITVHDVIPFNNRPLEMKTLDFIYGKADRLLLHTESSVRVYKKHYKSQTPISVITQGFCLKSDYQILDKTIARKYFNIPNDAIVFLYYGTIRKSKGLDYLIKAISKAYAQNKKVFLLAAGAFQKVSSEEYEKLVSDFLDIEFSNVSFKFVPFEEEQYYFSAADVLCLPYLEITQSGVAQVGLMYDLPIIATDIGEMADVARPTFNGELVKEKDIEELKDAILKLANDQDLVKFYSANSKKLGETDFALETKAKKVADVYRGLV